MDETNPLAVLRERVWQERDSIGKQLDFHINRGVNADRLAGDYSRIVAVLEWIDELLPPKLKPCPFCHSEDIETIVTLVPEWYACCNGCAAKGPLKETEAAAWEAWNQRA